MSTGAGAPDAPERVEARRAAVRARWFYTSLPIAALAALLAIAVPPALVGWIDYAQVVPLLLVFGAIVVLFVGAWFDFGAKAHVREVFRAGLPFSEADLVYIHRQQLLLTLCYMGVAGLYLVVAVALAVLR